MLALCNRIYGLWRAADEKCNWLQFCPLNRQLTCGNAMDLGCKKQKWRGATDCKVSLSASGLQLTSWGSSHRKDTVLSSILIDMMLSSLYIQYIQEQVLIASLSLDSGNHGVQTGVMSNHRQLTLTESTGGRV